MAGISSPPGVTSMARMPVAPLPSPVPAAPKVRLPGIVVGTVARLAMGALVGGTVLGMGESWIGFLAGTAGPA